MSSGDYEKDTFFNIMCGEMSKCGACACGSQIALLGAPFKCALTDRILEVWLFASR